jgi:hypothetical protein
MYYGISVICGILLYGYFNELIIIKNPWNTSYNQNNTYQKPIRTKILLFFWQHGQWKSESTSVVLSNTVQEKGLSILQAWIYEAYQNGFIKKNIIEAVLFEPKHKCLYISCDAPLLNTDQSTLENLYILESLIKTVRVALAPDVQYMQLLVHHELYNNPHINCSKPFSMKGLGILPQD